MRFRTSQDGKELTIWSIGEDLRDDLGTEEWATEAPRDVVVSLRVPEPKVAPSGSGRRARRKAR